MTHRDGNSWMITPRLQLLRSDENIDYTVDGFIFFLFKKMRYSLLLSVMDLEKIDYLTLICFTSKITLAKTFIYVYLIEGLDLRLLSIRLIS